MWARNNEKNVALVSSERVGREWTQTLESPIRWSQLTFVLADHLGMTKEAAFSDYVLFPLPEQARCAVLTWPRRAYARQAASRGRYSRLPLITAKPQSSCWRRE